MSGRPIDLLRIACRDPARACGAGWLLRSRGPCEAVTLPTVSAASTTTTEGFGVAVTREDTTWRCSLLAPSCWTTWTA